MMGTMQRSRLCGSGYDGSNVDPAKPLMGTESTTNLNGGDWNGGVDHPRSLAPTTKQADGRKRGEDHPTVCRQQQTRWVAGSEVKTTPTVWRLERIMTQCDSLKVWKEILEGNVIHRLENITTFRVRRDVLSNFLPFTIAVFEWTFASSDQSMKAMSHGEESVAKDVTTRSQKTNNTQEI